MRVHKESVIDGLGKEREESCETNDFVVCEMKKGPDVTTDNVRE